ncbi:Na+/H+ antiporter subunit D, partial [Vibrio genomosp. F10 str. 9ZD137]
MMILMPVLIPMFAAALSMLLWKHRTLQRWISVISNFSLLVAAITLFNKVYTSGIQATNLGGWEAPFGITLVADLLADRKSG